MVNLLEALYLLTAVSAIVTLTLWWRERRSSRPRTVRVAARHWAGITGVLAVICAALYWYLASR
jgi:uncharacterized iron-regulated membrane protein